MKKKIKVIFFSSLSDPNISEDSRISTLPRFLQVVLEHI